MNPTTAFSRTRWLQWALSVTTAATWTVAFPSPTEAITFSIDVQDHGMNPQDDFFGWHLQNIADAAAWYWEDYLPEPLGHGVDMWWDNTLDPDILGEWTWQGGGLDAHIKINPNPEDKDGNPLQWYMDPTPKDHSEFDFVTKDRDWDSTESRWKYRGGQWLYRDVTPGEQDLWFDGNPPALMEVGYRGRASDPTIQSQLDLFSTVIHELGHELGINDTGGPWEANPAWVGGATVTFLENEDEDHLADRAALMAGSAGMLGTRRFPSAVDIMAAADDEDMTSIDLPRQDYLSGDWWHHAPSWLGGTVPDSSDAAFIRHGGTVTLNGNATVETLFISEVSHLSTSLYRLEVPIRTDVVSTGAFPCNIHVENGGEVVLNSLTLAGGILHMDGGSAELTGITVITDNEGFTGEISGHGSVDLPSGWLINNGAIKATLTGMTFNAPNIDSYFDLDGIGAEDGLVDASMGSLTFDGKIGDAFHGTMKIGNLHSIALTNWTLGLGGVLELNGGNQGPATLKQVVSDVTTTVEGLIMVDREGRLATQRTDFEATAYVAVPDGDDRLILDTVTTFRGGTYVGDGAIEQQGDVQVLEDTTIDAHEYDWGNSTETDPHNTYITETLTQSVTFTIDSATTGTPRNEYRGTIFVLGSTLAVNLDTGWLLPRRGVAGTVAGTLVLDARGMHTPKVTGVPLTVEGYVHANGGVALMEADFITSPWAQVTVALDAELLLKGHNTYDGGAITGEGEIGQWGYTNVISNTTIDTQYYDLDGDESSTSAMMIHPGVEFTINSQRIDKPGGSFDGSVQITGGMLTINVPGSWTLGPSGVLGLTNAAGSAMVVGSPIAIGGNVTTRGGNEIFSIVTFGNSATVVATTPGDILRLRGHTNYEGGSYTGTGGIIQDATAFVNAPTTIDLGFFDMDGIAENSLVELHADLTLNVDRLDMNDNRFNGILEVTDPAKFTANTSTPWSMAGAMNVVGAPGTQLTVAGADVVLDTDVYIDEDNILEFEANVSGPGKLTGTGLVSFLGKYSPGSSPATVTAEGDVSFGDSAWLVLEIGGTVAAAEYDRLLVDGDVTLDGTVVFRFTDGFGPRQGDLFDVIVAGEATLSLLEAEDILIENLAPGFLYDVGFTERGGVFRLTALNDGMFVPEPSPLVLLGVGGMGLLAYAWRKRQRCRRSAAS